MKTVDGIMCVIEKLCVLIGCIGTTAAFLIMTAQVFSRYVLNTSFSWSEEVSLLCIVYAAMFASITLYKYSTHPSVAMLYDRYSPLIQAVMDIFFHLIETVVLAVLIVYGAQVVKRTSLAILPSSGINRGVLFYPIVVASAMHFLQVLVLIWKDIDGLAKKTYLDKEQESK